MERKAGDTGVSQLALPSLEEPEDSSRENSHSVSPWGWENTQVFQALERGALEEEAMEESQDGGLSVRLEGTGA